MSLFILIYITHVLAALYVRKECVRVDEEEAGFTITAWSHSDLAGLCLLIFLCLIALFTLTTFVVTSGWYSFIKFILIYPFASALGLVSVKNTRSLLRLYWKEWKEGGV